MQKRKGMKLIASMLIFMLTVTHLNVISEVLATSLESQTAQTNHANVEFDVYFVEKSGKEHAAIKTIGDENYLNAAISVKNAGYLKNAVITLDNANFEISQSLQNSKVSKVEENKIYFNQIKNGNTVELAIPIEMPYEENIVVEQLNKESKVKLTATYVDGNGKENKIEKDITVSLAWKAEAQAELSMQISKFIPYNVNENKGLVLQTLVQSYLKDNSLPVKENKIEISVPTINGVKPQEIKVLANSTKATNGDETAKSFTQENYTYDNKTNKLTITVNNQLDENNKVSWKKQAQDEFVVTYIYPETAITTEEVKLTITANNELTIYGPSEEKITKTFEGEVTLKEQISNLVDFSIATNVDTLSKGQIYANYDAQNKIETEYQEIISANIAVANLTDKIILEQNIDKFVTAENKKSQATQTYYKTITVDKNEFDKILGEEGTISFYLGTTEVAKIDKTVEASKQGKFVVDLSELNINSLRIETSKPKTEGKLNFTILKAIKGDVGYTKLQMANFNRLEVNLSGKAVNGETNFVEQLLTKEITFKEPTSQAELVIDNSKLSTVVTNENVKMTAVLKTDTLDCKLFKNPTLQIILPNCIENINIKNIEVLFDTEASKLTLKSHQIIQNTDGTKTLLINLEGMQTEYTLGAVSKGVNVIITSDITINKFTPNKQEQIKMVYANGNTMARTAETNEIATTVNIVAPVGVITTSTISNYKEGAEPLTSISGEEKTATIPILSEARNANLSMEVINNYNNTIDTISILGRTAFKGNKDILTKEALGTTVNMPLTSNITVNGVDASKVVVYYSENANATKDISVGSNAWTLTPASLENVKSYLIVLTDYKMNTGDKINFNYTMQIPEKLQHNESAFENYVVYFNNNLETGKIADKQASTKIGITTGRGPVIETSLTSNKKETEEVLTGNIIKYTLTVKNTGTETAENVVATIDLPEGLRHVELQEGSTTDYDIITMQGQTKLELGNIEANKTVEKEILMQVGILSASEDTKIVETKAIITSSNISGQLETKVIKNTLARTHFIITPTVLTEGNVLRENDSYKYYMEVLSSSLYETKEETVLTIKLPEEIVFESVEIKDKVKNTETDITETTTYNYDSKTRTLTINLGNVDGMNPKAIYLNVKVGTLAEGVYDKQVNIDAKVSAKDSRTQQAIIDPVQIGKVAFKVTQNSNIPENTHITAGEDLKYIFTIENLSNVDLYNVKVTDILPEELSLEHILATYESGNTKSSYNNSINLTIKGRETVKLEVNVSVNIIDETKTISNKATIEYEGIDTITTSSYKHVIEKFKVEDFDDGTNNNPSSPSNQTKRIMGTVWIDENINGQRDEEETKVSDVEMLLFNNQTGNLVTDSKGNVLKTRTDENGTYTFAGVNKGKYTVIYLYDTANYSATTYRKEGVDSSINSDGVDTQIALNGVVRIAAITEEVAITDSNIYNIDLGLVSNPKFDLKLDKTVSKITVQDANGTQVYEFNDSKLAKKDLVGKQIAGTTIIVEYKIKVTNEGAISGFVKKIADYMPEEMKFNSELNKDWYTSQNGVIYNSSLANTIINPGESKVVTLILTKKMTDDNLGLYHNEAEIYEAYNDLGIEDVDSAEGNKLSNEDDISSADVLITVKTGEVILYTGLALTIIVIISIGIYLIRKKILK